MSLNFDGKSLPFTRNNSAIFERALAQIIWPLLLVEESQPKEQSPYHRLYMAILRGA